jgi:hypothetical protein
MRGIARKCQTVSREAIGDRQGKRVGEARPCKTDFSKKIAEPRAQAARYPSSSSAEIAFAAAGFRSRRWTTGCREGEGSQGDRPA